MLFSSYIFIFAFLPITLFVYYYLNHKHMTEASKAFLVLASLFFYSWWNIGYLPIILVSMLFNYVIGVSLSLEDKKIKVKRKTLLIIGIVSNILLLGYFKYADFLIENVNMLTRAHIPLLHLALPLAISFFTFQQIAYLADSYKGETKEYDFLNYANFVTFFPQLIAGPIVHHSEMMPQFSKMRNKVKNYQNIALGLFIFSIGLFKKVVIADSFSIWVTQGFDVANSLNFFDAWATSLSYTFQLYFDFSGYTDMAIGVALLFNIKLPINFNSPYKAINIQDFWRRWHITLSRFLREYVYIPLGGNRKGSIHTYTNLMATFIIGGIWHGAGWTFIFWGFLHGLALVVQKMWNSVGLNMHNVLAWIITFNFINIAWVFFRAKEWKDALKVLHGMFDFHNIVVSSNFVTLYDTTIKKIFFMMPDMSKDTVSQMIFDFATYAWIIFAFYLVLNCKNSNIILSSPIKNLYAVYYSFLFMCSVLVLSMSEYSEFIYFNF